MTRESLIQQINLKKSFLCVGLDPDTSKMPACVLEQANGNIAEAVFAFNKAVIDATLPYAVCYKPNTAFYEAYGLEGMKALQKTAQYLQDKNVLMIADAKRGDIGNTSARYAQAFLSPEGGYNFDAITVAPYMGKDSVEPFFMPGKWVVLLALTSNPGSADFQTLHTEDPLYKQVLRTSQTWGTEENMMYVVGATKASMLKEVRQIVPKHFLLVPGVGAQGGSLREVCENGLIAGDAGLLVNSSRGILYAGKDKNFAEAAAQEAYKIQQTMALYV